MPATVISLPPITAASTGANATTNPIGGIDGASSLTIYMTSSAAAASTGNGLSLQVSMFDPSLASSASPRGVLNSTAYQTLSSLIFSSGTGLITSSGYAITLSNISFRGFRIAGLTSATAGETIAWATLQMSV